MLNSKSIELSKKNSKSIGNFLLIGFGLTDMTWSNPNSLSLSFVKVVGRYWIVDSGYEYNYNFAKFKKKKKKIKCQRPHPSFVYSPLLIGFPQIPLSDKAFSLSLSLSLFLSHLPPLCSIQGKNFRFLSILLHFLGENVCIVVRFLVLCLAS